MALDPLSTLSLAGNIAQFIEFLCRVLSESGNLYKSTSGASAEHVILEKVTKDLRHLSDNLTVSSVDRLVPGEGELNDLAYQSKDVAGELLRSLEELKVKGSHRRFKSIVQAFRQVGKKDQIESFARRLDKLQSQLNIRLLALMRRVSLREFCYSSLISMYAEINNRAF